MGRAPVRPARPVRPALAKCAVDAKAKQQRALAKLQEYQWGAGSETGRGVFGETEAHRRRRGVCGAVPVGPRFQAVVPKFGSSEPSRERGDQLLYRPPTDDEEDGDARENRDPASHKDCDCFCVVQ